MKEIRDIPNGVSLHFFCTDYEYVAVHEVRVYCNNNGKKRGGAKVCKVDILPIEWYTIS